MLNETPLEAARAIRTLVSDVDATFINAIKALRRIPGNIQPTSPKRQATRSLSQSSIILKSTISQVAALLMWTPYIAFYGETNAGKSTLIEALRLYFGQRVPDVGSSIGDGRSDFSQDATFHHCSFRDRTFTLIDVPGIEGQERVVKDAITNALARSQVVFYITPDARPPQGGEKGRDGTLEKVARHLKPQAKIWSIWNKKIHSPRALAKPLLVEGSDEWRSLHEGANSLDAKMREVLGMRYQTCIPVSARPAFLALATHLVPDSKLTEERARFLERIPEAQLVKACGIDQVAAICINGIPNAADIVHANFSKCTMPIRAMADEILEIARTNFLKPASELDFAIKKLELGLENIAEDARRNLRRLSDELIQKTIGSVRSQMMDAIQSGIENDKSLKRIIESILKQEKVGISNNIQLAVQKIVLNTRDSVRDALKIMKAELAQEDIFSIPNFTANFDHTIEIGTKNGADWAGLGTAISTAVLAVLLTGGWALFFGIAGALMSAWSAVASFFDPGYKKEQQKRVLNYKLLLVRKELSLSIPRRMDEIAADVAKVVRSQAVPFRNLSVDYTDSGQILVNVSLKLSSCLVLIPGLPPSPPI